jgi:hypothetical protein
VVVEVVLVCVPPSGSTNGATPGIGELPPEIGIDDIMVSRSLQRP